MKRYILLAFLFLSLSTAFGQYTVRGGSGIPLKNNIPAQKLDVYLLYGMQGAEITYTSSGQEKHQWYRYATKANEAVAIESQQSGNTSTITNVEEGYGYFVGSNLSPSTSYIWIIDYSKYLPVFQSININEGLDKCTKLTINANVNAAALEYYTPSGVHSTLVRKYTLSYTTMSWIDSNKSFAPKDTAVTNIETPSLILLNEPPLQDTDFTLTGDKFAEHFGVGKSIATPVYKAIKVVGHGTEKSDYQKESNEMKNTESGPKYNTYTGYANEPVTGLYIWKIFYQPPNSSTMQSVARYTDKTIAYNFDKEGDYKVQLEVIDRSGVCNDTSTVFIVKIGKTEIAVPKAFSPGSSPGKNDEFKISYTSIVNFKCTIFNRWGTKLYEWNDPAKGWDGRVNGRLVPTGAYFYIIEYKTTTGKNKVEKGAVNILRAKY